MAQNFLTRSRHGTVYYFRRRVPKELHAAIGKPFLVRSLETTDRRTAVVRARSLAVQSDLIFQRTQMATKNTPGGLSIDLSYELDIPGLGKLKIDAEPEEIEAAKSLIRTTVEAAQGFKSTLPGLSRASTIKTLEDAIGEYFAKAQMKPQTKATYRSKLEHARKFFGGTSNLYDLGQGDLVRYCDHVGATIAHPTTQGLYISTVASFLNWHRTRVTGFPELTTRTLMHRKDTPDSDDRDAFTLDQIRQVFTNAQQYREKCPHKFWVSIAPVFLGCRIEEVCQVNLTTDLKHDEEAGIWYFSFDGRPDPDGIVRKSMKKIASWRLVPIHSALVRHGFIDFLRDQERARFLRPFQKEWQPREVADEEIIKWSHYISRWGGRELKELGARHQFDTNKLAYFHSMRHTFKSQLGNAGVSSEISEALSGRKHAGADEERYGKLKQNHRRLALEGIELGLVQLTAILDEVLTGNG
jgi:predicted Rdx family selenoprotein